MHKMIQPDKECMLQVHLLEYSFLVHKENRFVMIVLQMILHHNPTVKLLPTNMTNQKDKVNMKTCH